MVMALVIIDQQKGLDHPKLGSRNNPNAEMAMLEVLDYFRSRKDEVYHIKHRSKDAKSVFWPEQEGFDFKEAFLPINNEEVVEKLTPCAFMQTGLAEKLKDKNVESILIVGASTNNSIESSVRTASNMGFNVIVIEEACFTYEKLDFFGNYRSASDVHLMSLANLEGEYATVLSLTQFFSINR